MFESFFFSGRRKDLSVLKQVKYLFKAPIFNSSNWGHLEGDWN